MSICLDTTPEFWLNLQSAFDLRTAEQQHGDEIIGSATPGRLSQPSCNEHGRHGRGAARMLPA